MKEVVFQVFNLNSLFRGVKTIFLAKVVSEVQSSFKYKFKQKEGFSPLFLRFVRDVRRKQPFQELGSAYTADLSRLASEREWVENEKSAQPISRKGQIYKNNYLYVADPCSDLNATEGFLSCTYQQENRVYLLSDPAKMGGWKECYIYIMAYI